MLLSICLFFCQFQPGVACESIAYKKKCVPHLIKDANFAELLTGFDSFLLGIWKMFYFSPKKVAILENVQSIALSKRPLKFLKAAVTHWLMHGRASQKILDCFKELFQTIDHICLETRETDIRGYQNMLMEHHIAFCLCFMTNILA